MLPRPHVDEGYLKRWNIVFHEHGCTTNRWQISICSLGFRRLVSKSPSPTEVISWSWIPMWRWTIQSRAEIFLRPNVADIKCTVSPSVKRASYAFVGGLVHLLIWRKGKSWRFSNSLNGKLSLWWMIAATTRCSVIALRTLAAPCTTALMTKALFLPTRSNIRLPRCSYAKEDF